MNSNKHKNKHDKHKKNELDEDYDSVPVHKPKRRKHRTTFPLSRKFTDDEYEEDMDKLYETQRKHKPKRKQSYPFAINDEYDKQQYMYIKEYNHKDKQYKKEIIIKNYKKVHPINDTEKEKEEEEEEEEENRENLLVIKIPTAGHLLSFLTKKILKLLCYLGIISCAAV